MLNQIMRFVKEEDGATAVEYGLMVSLIAAVIVVSVTALGANIATIYNNTAATILGS
jgi:pilus assembly protein Flp/PilA